jgi:hypothetical protein
LFQFLQNLTQFQPTQKKPWRDAVRLLLINPELDSVGQSKKRRHPKKSPNGSTLAYEPDYLRFYARVYNVSCES